MEYMRSLGPFEEFRTSDLAEWILKNDKVVFYLPGDTPEVQPGQMLSKIQADKWIKRHGELKDRLHAALSHEFSAVHLERRAERDPVRTNVIMKVFWWWTGV